MKQQHLLLLSLLLSLVVALIKADVCTFYNDGKTTYTVASALKACFDAVPFSTDYRDQTYDAIYDMINVYSATDIQTGSGYPWFATVDLREEMSTIKSTTFASDYDMHSTIQRLFKKLYDAHTEYILPSPYNLWTLVRPFSLKTELTNGNLVFTAAEENKIGIVTYSSYYLKAFNDTAPDLNQYLGKAVTEINGVPTLDYLQAVADKSGSFHDAGARLNRVLEWVFSEIKTDTQAPFDFIDKETYTFDDGSSATFDLPMFRNSIPFTDLDTLQALLPAKVARDLSSSSAEEFEEKFFEEEELSEDEEEDVQDEDDDEAVWKEQEEENRQMKVARFLLETRTFTQIAIALDNTAIAGYIQYNGRTIVVLRLTTFNVKKTGNAFRSFMNTVRAAVDYGEANNISELILDVRENGGGILCLAVNTLRVLFQAFRDNPPASQSHGDYRLGSGNYSKIPSASRPPNKPLVWKQACSYDNFTESEWMSTDLRRGYGESPYTTPVALFDCMRTYTFDRPTLANWTPTWFFPKIIALTDGQCGSACSILLSTPMAYGLLNAVSFGGRPGEFVDTSSFAGGSVESWNAFITRHNQYSNYTGLILTALPTTAQLSFNWFEYYAPGGTLPREYTKMPGIANLNIWPQHNVDKSSVLYDAVAPYFDSVSPAPTSVQCLAPVPGNTAWASSASSVSSFLFSHLFKVLS